MTVLEWRLELPTAQLVWHRYFNGGTVNLYSWIVNEMPKRESHVECVYDPDWLSFAFKAPFWVSIFSLGFVRGLDA